MKPARFRYRRMKQRSLVMQLSAQRLAAGLWASVVWSFLQIVFPMPPVGRTIFALLGAHTPAPPELCALAPLP